MSLKKIITIPDPILREKSQAILNFDNNTKKLMDDMLETMYAAPGIGLAAIQIGIAKRVIVIDVSKDQKKSPFFFVNPEIIWKSESRGYYEEGCLSKPNQFELVQRPEKCKVKYLDYNGQQSILEAEGILSTCIQHEVDHLNGVLFIDHLSKLKKSLIEKKASKQKKERERIVV